jgi:hypothetical protein
VQVSEYKKKKKELKRAKANVIEKRRTIMVEFIMAGGAGWLAGRLGRRRKKVQYYSDRVKWKKKNYYDIAAFPLSLAFCLALAPPFHVTWALQ